MTQRGVDFLQIKATNNAIMYYEKQIITSKEVEFEENDDI